MPETAIIPRLVIWSVLSSATSQQRDQWARHSVGCFRQDYFVQSAAGLHQEIDATGSAATESIKWARHRFARCFNGAPEVNFYLRSVPGINAVQRRKPA